MQKEDKKVQTLTPNIEMTEWLVFIYDKQHISVKGLQDGWKKVGSQVQNSSNGCLLEYLSIVLP